MSAVSADGPNLAFQLVPEPRTVKNQVHIDLAADDREKVVARVIELGGKRVHDHKIEGFH